MKSLRCIFHALKQTDKTYHYSEGTILWYVIIQSLELNLADCFLPNIHKVVCFFYIYLICDKMFTLPTDTIPTQLDYY